MAEFFNVLPPDEARALLLAHVRPTGETEVVPTAEALGRVTAGPTRAPHPLSVSYTHLDVYKRQLLRQSG